MRARLVGHAGTVRQMLVLPDESNTNVNRVDIKDPLDSDSHLARALWSAGSDGIIIWDLPGRVVRRLTQHGCAVLDLLLKTNDVGQWVFSVGQDGTVLVWDVQGECLRRLTLNCVPAATDRVSRWVHAQGVLHGSFVWSHSKGAAIVAWDTETGASMHRMELQVGSATSLIVAPEPDGSLSIWVGTQNPGGLLHASMDASRGSAQVSARGASETRVRPLSYVQQNPPFARAGAQNSRAGNDSFERDQRILAMETELAALKAEPQANAWATNGGPAMHNPTYPALATHSTPGRFPERKEVYSVSKLSDEESELPTMAVLNFEELDSTLGAAGNTSQLISPRGFGLSAGFSNTTDINGKGQPGKSGASGPVAPARNHSSGQTSSSLDYLNTARLPGNGFSNSLGPLSPIYAHETASGLSGRTQTPTPTSQQLTSSRGSGSVASRFAQGQRATKINSNSLAPSMSALPVHLDRRDEKPGKLAVVWGERNEVVILTISQHLHREHPRL